MSESTSDSKKKQGSESEEDSGFFFEKEKELIEQVKSRRDLKIVRGGKADQPVGPQTSSIGIRASGIIKRAA